MRLERPICHIDIGIRSMDNGKETEAIVVASRSDVLHVSSRLVFVAGLVAANGTHFVVVIVVLVRVLGGVLVGVLLHVLYITFSQAFVVPQLPSITYPSPSRRSSWVPS
jgi:hypothetical protein